MRLDKFLAQSQIGTRKIVREYVKDGLVKINGITIFEPAVEINEIED
ncbi:S4 domain-containing protein, partial [Clostridium sp.]